jgi:hypothetical protein
LKYQDTIFDNCVQNPFLQQTLHAKVTAHSTEKSSQIPSGHVKKNLLRYLYRGAELLVAEWVVLRKNRIRILFHMIDRRTTPRFLRTHSAKLTLDTDAVCSDNRRR